MSLQSRVDPGRSQRDELERLQEALREARRQRQALPRENAELAARVEALEREVRWLRRTVEVARGEAERPAASLPEQLRAPFKAIPSRRTTYGRMRFALRAMLPALVAAFYLVTTLLSAPKHLLWVGSLLLVIFAGLYISQGLEDESQGHAWSFDEEGFGPEDASEGGERVRYASIQRVEVKQGLLERLYGFGSVRVTWTPTLVSSLGRAVGYPNRAVDIEMLDDPRRLAEWIRERAHAERVGSPGGTHVA